MGNIYILKCGLGNKKWKVQVGNPSTYHTIVSLAISLIDLILTIQASTTAGCERGFSVIKSQRTSTLSDLMCRLLESCDIDEYDPFKACGLWAGEIVRKSLYSRVKTAKSF